MSAAQLWECPKCKRTHKPALPVIEVRCNNKHGSAGSMMRLIGGTLPEKRNPRRKT